MIKFFRMNSIRQKLFTGMFLTTLSALLIFGTALVAYDLRDYHARLVEDLATQGRLVGLTVVPALQFDDRSVAAKSLAVLSVRPRILAAAVYDADGSLFATYRNRMFDENPELAAPSFPEVPEAGGQRLEGDSLVLFRRIVQNGEVLGTIYIEGRHQLYDRLSQYAGIVLVAMLLALVISMLISLRMQKQITLPILGITSLARRMIERRDYSLRAEKLTDDEIGYLVDAFNDLLAEVEFRSAALESSNSQLQQEIADRQQAAEEIRSLNAQLEHRVAERTAELERANQELEAFSYSVSHDLRAPLRAIDGFSQALLEDYAAQLDDVGEDYLHRVRAAAQRMGQLIDDLLKLARVSRATLNQEPVDLSAIVEAIVDDLRSESPGREADVSIEQGLAATGDAHLIRIALENLLHNAWKYTGKRAGARIEFGQDVHDGQPRYFVRDNGAGFDMAYAGKLFGAFQRLHDAKEYAGTGVGLATVQRIIHRHGGRIWADAAVDAGAVFYFTLPATRNN
jgi:signal transduction histidine kinase